MIIVPGATGPGLLKSVSTDGVNGKMVADAPVVDVLGPTGQPPFTQTGSAQTIATSSSMR